MTSQRCTIIPPYMMDALANSSDSSTAERGTYGRRCDEHLRSRRPVSTSPGRPSAQPGPAPQPPAPSGQPAPKRTIDDAQHTETLPGQEVRSEGGPAGSDPAVNEAYDGLGDTWRLYWDAYHRNSLDDRGLPLLASVHYGTDYDNAFWNGDQMVFGDGDGVYFNRFTLAVDVIGHELTHGVTQYTVNLAYSGQSGALNESISDVFGSLVKQRHLNQTADQADWLIGVGLFTAKVQGRALRDLAHPGTAYDDPQLGKDPQPGSMSGYVTTTDDNGGVHTNSGIPSRAFYLAATAIGGNAWQAPGEIWYAVLTGSAITADCDFATFAQLTIDEAGSRFGQDSAQQQAVRTAWTTVEVLPADSSSPAPDAAEVRIARTGGLMGRTVERSVRLTELSGDDAGAWGRLLNGDELTRLASSARERSYPDAYSYRVHNPAAGLDVTVPEPGLTEELRALFRRALGR